MDAQTQQEQEQKRQDDIRAIKRARYNLEHVLDLEYSRESIELISALYPVYFAWSDTYDNPYRLVQLARANSCNPKVEDAILRRLDESASAQDILISVAIYVFTDMYRDSEEYTDNALNNAAAQAILISKIAIELQRSDRQKAFGHTRMEHLRNARRNEAFKKQLEEFDTLRAALNSHFDFALQKLDGIRSAAEQTQDARDLQGYTISDSELDESPLSEIINELVAFYND